ncbi:unnamed protein product [Rotaria sordida]|uniref:Uncharacterized protein n=1 Tax=Rotaria sordida TaxID=392033 RepID=A0A819LTU7_9BILA|nr:unnamed protein product [Rotaria sordida]
METINYYPSDTTIGSDRLGAPESDSPYDLALGPFDKKMIVVLLVIKGFVIHFYEQINEHMKLNPPSSTKIEVTTKNLLTIRQQLIKDFETRAFKTKKKFCPNCNTPVRALRADSH